MTDGQPGQDGEPGPMVGPAPRAWAEVALQVLGYRADQGELGGYCDALDRMEAVMRLHGRSVRMAD